MPGIVTSINAPRALTKLRIAAMVRNTSIDNWLCESISFKGTGNPQTFLGLILALYS